jgi:hypothetical protein
MRELSKMVINRKLDEFAVQREGMARFMPNSESHFGLSKEGEYINHWHMGYERLGSFFTVLGLNFSGVYRFVAIDVPTTDTGIVPLTLDDQPYGWDGKINAYTAEMAVWWAFELMDEREAREFMEEHCPVVIFNFMEAGKWRSLTTRFNGATWIAERMD